MGITPLVARVFYLVLTCFGSNGSGIIPDFGIPPFLLAWLLDFLRYVLTCLSKKHASSEYLPPLVAYPPQALWVFPFRSSGFSSLSVTNLSLESRLCASWLVSLPLMFYSFLLCLRPNKKCLRSTAPLKKWELGCPIEMAGACFLLMKLLLTAVRSSLPTNAISQKIILGRAAEHSRRGKLLRRAANTTITKLVYLEV